MKPWVVMRARNDMPLAAETLAALKRQSEAFELLVFDNASTDGTREEAAKHTDHIIDVAEDDYMPGRVLNRAMEMTEGELVAFVNADCTPADAGWLATLYAAFTDVNVAAVFGRQVPRPGCAPLFAKDTEDTFGEGDLQQRWRHCFSMASSAIRRSVWEQRHFDEELRYSEDIEWTWAARKRGYGILYAPKARAWHSHNYSLAEAYRRQRGEGEAEAKIFNWSFWQRSFLRHTAAPCARKVLSDWAYCLPRFRLISAALSPILRSTQALGRRAGFRSGWKARSIR